MFSSYNDQQFSNDNKNETTVTVNTTNRTQRSITKPSKQLPEKAVRLMNAWFDANEDNPYPNRNDLDYLATNGEIKESQVKAWFSNKRNRTQNTHPKRAKRYLIRNQTQPYSTLWNEPQKIHLADELEQRALSMQSQSYANTQIPPIPSPTNWPWVSPTVYDYYPTY
ncbi:hypothetical protein I4U23_002000 [Adineta vaga]|nr:hypothetical protein I4U23_002000 [Adineta vaga]